MSLLEHLALEYIKAQHTCHVDVEEYEDRLMNELAIYDSEAGATTEGGYCPDASLERVIEAAHVATDRKYDI